MTKGQGLTPEMNMKRQMLFVPLAVIGAVIACPAGFGSSTVAFESARTLPLVGDYDVVIAGGTSAGVAAAVAAHDAGARVFLAGGRPYLGEDLAGTLELDNDGAEPSGPLTKSLWTSFTDLAPYDYTYDAKISRACWSYCNDAPDRVRDSVWPMTSAEVTVFNRDVTYSCLLQRPARVKRIEVVVVETPDDWLDAAKRPKQNMDSILAKVSDVTVVLPKFLFLKREIPLSRVASKVSGSIHYRQRANLVTFAADLDENVGEISKADVCVSLGKGAQEVCVSRIWFRLASDDTGLRQPTPLKVKQTLDRELVSRRIPFLTGSPVTDLLRDRNGRVAGVVIANRSGRQALRAKCIVDATRYGTLSRLGGGLGISGDAAFSRTIVKSDGKLTRIPLTLPIGDGSFPCLAAAEEAAREMTWCASMRDDADEIVLKTPLPPANKRDGLFAIDPQQTLEGRIAAASAFGKAAAKIAKSRSMPTEVLVEPYAGCIGGLQAEGDVKELLGSFRPYLKRSAIGKIHSPARALPVLATCDVLVCGGGTSGAAAALGAAKGGAKTIVAEWLYVLGGVGTDGMIVSYCAGNNRGFTREFCKDECRMGATHTYSESRKETSPDPDPANRAETMYYQRAEVWRRRCRDAGVSVWYGTFVEGAYMCGDKVVGAVVVTPFGRGVIRARSVVDATGNADVAAAAGAETEFLPKSELQLQSAGQAPHRFRGKLVNTDFGFVNDADAWDLWLFGVRARAGALDAWDLQKLPDSRERRHIVPDYAVCGEDVVAGRKFPDTVVQPIAPQDAHGPLLEDFCYVAAPSKSAERVNAWTDFRLNVPLRSLLPRGLSNIAVVGTGAGCSRDVMPMVRMQADLMNMGYAVGLGAALAPGGDFRRLNIDDYRSRLVDEDILEEDARHWKDEADYTSDEAIAAAIKTMPEVFRGSDVVFRRENRTKALPLLRKAYSEATSFKARFVYAETLGFMGDATGVKTLVDAANGAFDLGSVHPQGRFGDRVNNRTGLLIALGRTRSPLACQLVSKLIGDLKADSSMETVRGVMLAAEALGDKSLCLGLENYLALPGIAGHAVASPYELGGQGGYGPDFEMRDCMRELSGARALLFCGDPNGVAYRTLDAYARDARGVLAEYASNVLRKAAERK